MKVNSGPGDPVISAWICSDNHYAFIELRSSEEADNLIRLTNVSILNQIIKIGRPKTYPKEDKLCQQQTGEGLQDRQSSWLNSEDKTNMFVQFPTKILIFDQIFTGLKLDDEKSVKEAKEDISLECCKYGRVVRCEIPLIEEYEDALLKYDDTIPHFYLNAYIEAMTIEESKEMRRYLCNRKYNNRYVTIKYFPEEKFYNRDFVGRNSIV